MDTLKDLQRNFIKDCLSPDFSKENIAMRKNLKTEKISAYGSMGIYRESAIGNLHKILQLTYPVIEKLVGKEFFELACRKFIEQNWPETGNMDDYGEDFPVFLENFEPAKDLIYLSDTAKLEWLFHQSSIAEDSPTLEQKDIAKIPPEQYSDLELHIHPSVNFIKSKFPINKIWEMNQEGADSSEELNIDEEKEVYLMIVRPLLKTNIIEITKTESCFLQNLKGKSLFEAYESASNVNEDFDLSDILQKHLSLQNFSGFTIGIK